MYGNVIAICLLAMPVVALVAMMRAWSPADDDMWVRVSATAWFPALWLALWTTMYLLPENGAHDLNPFVFAIPLLSWLGVSLCCKLGKTRKWGLAALLLLLGVAFALSLVMPEGWADAVQDRDNAMALRLLRSRLLNGHRDLSNSKIPPGFMDTPPRDDLWRPDRRLEEYGLTEQHIHRPVWHTWLTGLYLVETKNAGIWYPGGKPSEAANGLSWRPR